MNKMIVLTGLVLISTNTEGTNGGWCPSDAPIGEQREVSMVDFANARYDKAITECNVDEIKYFIELGADVNKVDTYGNTPLIMACRYGYEDLVRYLVERGANVNKRCNEQDLLEISLEEADSDVVKRLMSCAISIEKGNNVLRLIVLHDDFMECVEPDLIDVDTEGEEVLIATDVLYDHCSKRMTAYIPRYNIGFRGLAALHCACKNGYESIVKYLVEHGADINQEDLGGGHTPLFWARHENIVKYLVEKGAYDLSEESSSDSDESSNDSSEESNSDNDESSMSTE